MGAGANVSIDEVERFSKQMVGNGAENLGNKENINMINSGSNMNS